MRAPRPGRIRDVLAHLAQAAVGCGEHRGHPVAAGVERRAPRLCGDVLRVVLPERGLHLVARARAPAHRARVAEEHDGAHDAVAQGATVAVGVVGLREPDAALVARVAHERDGRGVAAEGGAREREAPLGALERLAHGVAPAERIARVVHLVEDHERAPGVRELAVQARAHGDRGVGDDDAVELPRFAAVAVAEARVEADPGAVRGVRPLHLEVLGRGHDGDAVDDAPLQELGCQAQREGRLAGARRRRHEEVPSARGIDGGIEVGGEGLLLPRPELARGAPGGALGEARREMLGGGGGAEHPLSRRLAHSTQG